MLQFVDELVGKWGFTGELNYKSLEVNKVQINESERAKIDLISSKLTEVNEDRLKNFFESTQVSNHEIQIKVLGACLNFNQLYELLVLIHSHREAFSKLSDRVVSRTLKVFEMSPSLQILHR